MTDRPAQPPLSALLDAAVVAVGGESREGQHEMATAVADALESGEHLLVQAGTGTGKSLAYLVPVLAHHDSVVVATATIALQRQLVDRDLPTMVDALAPLLGRRPTFAMLKGRSNYVCLHRLNSGEDEPDDQDALFDPTPTSKAGRDVVRIRSWAESTETGDRDELAPAPDPRAWRSLSVTPHECLGAQKCTFAADCFTEQARARAKDSDVVVTNHAMLAIDSLSDAQLLPEVDVVVVDEAHELADRATGAVTDELTSAIVERAGRRSKAFAGEDASELLVDAAELLAGALAEAPEGRVETPTGALFDALVAVRDAGHSTLSAMGGQNAGDDDAAKRVLAKAAVDEVYEIAGRIVAAGLQDVVWVTKSEFRAPTVWRAPLFVGDMLRGGLFDERTVVLTSATLELGGGFEPIARNLGLSGDEAPAWRGLDVGSPFEYGKQAILYVAAHLPPPGRGGVSPEALDEIEELVTSAGGRTLGLFSSMAAAKAAAEEMRERLDLPVLCQGDDATGALVRQFAADAQTCLFGTMSLWQGVDVPGSALQLVIIDRLPFPRPDDPLASARQRYVEANGGNGFMTVAATQAALRLAQGAGRLIRNATDKGVVAVLDSRLDKARYGSYIRSSLPPMWHTTDKALVVASLNAIDEKAPPVLPVSEAVIAADGPVEAPGGGLPAGDRQRRRWTEDEGQLLRERWAEGTPPGLIAEELSRTKGAIISRLQTLELLGRIEWANKEAMDPADRAVGYSLRAIPPASWGDVGAITDCLTADDWQVEPVDDTTLRVHNDDADTLVGIGSTDGLLMGAATSRWLLTTDPDVKEPPSGIDGMVAPPRM